MALPTGYQLNVDSRQRFADFSSSLAWKKHLSHGTPKPRHTTTQHSAAHDSSDTCRPDWQSEFQPSDWVDRETQLLQAVLWPPRESRYTWLSLPRTCNKSVEKRSNVWIQPFSCRSLLCTFVCFCERKGYAELIFLPHYPRCWDSRHVPPSPALKQGPLTFLYHPNKLLSCENMTPRTNSLVYASLK